MALNRAQGSEAQQRAIVECRIELCKLADPQTYAVNALVIAFVVFVLVNGLLMIRHAAADPLYPHVLAALWVFLVFFVGLSGWLILSGTRLIRKVGKEIEPER